ncbi:MAG: hypothetical protein WC787_03715 [Patescibacteria group bacterium]|jgi:hypothetical protein
MNERELSAAQRALRKRLAKCFYRIAKIALDNAHLGRAEAILALDEAIGQLRIEREEIAKEHAAERESRNPLPPLNASLLINKIPPPPRLPSEAMSNVSRIDDPPKSRRVKKR